MDSNNLTEQGDQSQIPKELKKWNWGAFWLTWIWGIGNGCYIALLALLPIVNFIMPFYLGKKGNELLWENNSWRGIDEIKLTQRKWAIAGWICAIFVFSIMGLRINEAYKIDKINSTIANKVFIELKNNEEAKKLLGDNYTFISKPSISSVNMSTGTIPTDQIIILNGIEGPVMVQTTLDENYNIKEIIISPFYSDKKIYIDDINK